MSQFSEMRPNNGTRDAKMLKLKKNSNRKAKKNVQRVAMRQNPKATTVPKHDQDQNEGAKNGVL